MKILELYKDLAEDNGRFIDELINREEYREALPKLTILDIGAYAGEFAFYSLVVADKIYCFEPDPKPFAKLEERVNKYDLDKIKIYNMAVSDSSGTKVFHASGGGGSRILDSKAGYPEEEVIEVPTISLAEFIAKEDIKHIDILKIDIEGGEDTVFRSDDFKTIVDRIDLIIGEHLGSVADLLQSYGFKKTPIDNNANTLYKR